MSEVPTIKDCNTSHYAKYYRKSHKSKKHCGKHSPTWFTEERITKRIVAKQDALPRFVDTPVTDNIHRPKLNRKIIYSQS
jgi:hypothetical protein